jgi:hypothetical protein
VKLGGSTARATTAEVMPPSVADISVVPMLTPVARPCVPVACHYGAIGAAPQRRDYRDRHKFPTAPRREKDPATEQKEWLFARGGCDPRAVCHYFDLRALGSSGEFNVSRHGCVVTGH